MSVFTLTDLSDPLERQNARVDFVRLNSLVTRARAEEAVTHPSVDDASNPMQLLAAAVTLVPGGRQKDAHLNAVRNAIAASPGGSDLLTFFPDLPESLLFKSYEKLGIQNVAQLAKVDPESVRETAADLFETYGLELYEDQIFITLKSIGYRPSKEEVEAVGTRLRDQRISLNDPGFKQQVFKTTMTVKDERKYEAPFDRLKNEFTDGLDSDRERVAIQLLQSLGLKSSGVDEEWAKVALGVVGSDGGSSDIMTLAYSSDSLDSVNLGTDLPFPEFETDLITGLKPENIRTCADLYYIHIFDRLGIFRIVDSLGAKFFDSLNLGLSDTARKFYVYIKRRSTRFPDEDRQRITTQLFEQGPFKELFGRMVEAVVEYARSRNAGEFFTTGGDPTSASSATTFTIASVRRTVQNLQRYLSTQGGIAPFLARESGRQLLDCIDILKSPDLQQYYGGPYSEGMWGIVESVGQELDGKTPDADRMRTLAVHGRRIIKWLAENTSNGATLEDSDVSTLVDLVQNWLAAYRRPDLDPQPDWMHDDDGTAGGDVDPDKLAKSAISDAMKDATANGNGVASADDSKKPDVLGVA